MIFFAIGWSDIGDLSKIAKTRGAYKDMIPVERVYIPIPKEDD